MSKIKNPGAFLRVPAQTLLLAMILILMVAVSSTISGCSEEDPDLDNAVTTQGTVPLDTIKLGTPDQVFQEALVTFVRDQSAQANSGGKRQYLSRGDAEGGQYMVQVKEGSCFEIMVLYKDKPVSREAAEQAMKKLLPDGAPAQSRVDDSSLAQTGGKGQDFHAIYYFGDDYLGDLAFVDKSGNRVKSLKVSNISLLKQAQIDSQAVKDRLKPVVENAKKAESGEKKD